MINYGHKKREKEDNTLDDSIIHLYATGDGEVRNKEGGASRTKETRGIKHQTEYTREYTTSACESGKGGRNNSQRRRKMLEYMQILNREVGD